MAEEEAKLDVDKIRALIALMEKRGLSRLALTEEGITVRLGSATQAPVFTPAPVVVPEHFAPHTAAASAETPTAPEAPEGVALLSPTTGTFYRRPAPGEPPFVDVGDVVEIGQTVGIIMAMKVMSEVPAEVAGEIVAIPAGDAELVHLGSPLVVVRPL